MDGICPFVPTMLIISNLHPKITGGAHERKLIDQTVDGIREELGERLIDRELGAMGYKFQFVTPAGFHSLNLGMFDLACNYKKGGMAAYSDFQQTEFRHGKSDGYRTITHQKFAGTGYYDRVMNAITEGESPVEALTGST